MDNFFGRKEELETLNTLYVKKNFEMLVLYGRRRVGKSTLITEFLKGKKSVYFTAIEDSIEKNLELFSKRIMESLSSDAGNSYFSSFEDACLFISNKSEKERIVVAIDEFPYLAEQNSSILSIFQNIIDNDWKNKNIFFIISGSSMSFMENKVLGEKSPLFGRRTAQIKLMPFSFEEAALFVPDYSYEDKSVCFGITGGIAKYLSIIDSSISLDENIKKLYFSRSGYLYEEPHNLLIQEFRNVSSYSTVINVIASGRNKLQDIADEAHMSAPTVTNLLQNLMLIGIVKKRTAITEEKNKKKIQYVLTDGMFKFWYRFVPDAIDYIEMGRGDIYYDRFVKPHIDEYMGSIFEEMCRYYTLKSGINGKLKADILKVGTWWGADPKKKEQTDIDVVGIDTVSNKAILGECKYKNEILDKSIMEALIERTGLIDSKYRTVEYLLFSKSGFSDWVVDNAKDKDVRPISLEEMYK